MNIGSRLETIAKLVPTIENCVLADIGTDHAYLPVYLMRQNRLQQALACDIAAGPCAAARGTIAQYNLADRIEVRQGSGLSVVKAGEANVITIAGMGGSTIADILQADLEVAKSADTLILQPMAGAANLRKYLIDNGWQLIDEELVDDAPHFYEIIVAKRAEEEHKDYSEAEYVLGPVLLQKRHSLLEKQFSNQLNLCRNLLEQMGRSERAKASDKYKSLEQLLQELEVLAHDYGYCK